MSRNIRVIWAASVIFGLALGCYDFVLPYYLKERGLAYPRMAAVFALSSIAMFFVRVYTGRLSDLFGRKRFYSLALLGSGLANLFTPMAGSVGILALLRSLREASVVTRESMHALLLYRENRGRYAESVGKTLGSEYVFQGLGTLAAGAIMAAMGMAPALFACAVALFGACTFFSLAFREKKDPDGPVPPAVSWLRLFSFDMPRELRIIAATSVLFSVGLSCSHSFIMPLFFTEKFGAPAGGVALIMAIHRISLGAPMLFAGWISRLPPRNTYAAFVAIEGAILAASALIPAFVPAAAVWLLHDLFGAGVWMPIQSAMIQRYSGESARGLHVSKTLAFSALGWIAGPFLSGYLAGIDISAPFLASGILVGLSAAPLLLLPDGRKPAA